MTPGGTMTRHRLILVIGLIVSGCGGEAERSRVVAPTGSADAPIAPDDGTARTINPRRIPTH